MPSICTGCPPRCASITTTPSASTMSTQRSRVGWSASADRAHHRADVERLLATGVLGEDLADGREVACRARVRRGRDVAVDRVARRRGPREPLARRPVRVRVVGEQDVDAPRDVRRPVLRLPVRAHDPVVAADAEVVLGRDAAGVVEALLAGEDHRRVRRHDQDAPGVHEHRRLGVPVRLGADVDAGDDDVDLAAVLGELDDRPQHAGDPVHVLGAGVHGDLRARRDREPLDRRVQPAGERRSRRAPAGTRARRSPRARGSGRRAARRGSCPPGSARVAVVTVPSTMLAVLRPGPGRPARPRRSSSRSYSVNVPSAPPRSGLRDSIGTSSYGYTAPRRRARITFCV